MLGLGQSSTSMKKWKRGFDKSICTGTQTSVCCVGFRHTQVYAFISRSSHSELV